MEKNEGIAIATICMMSAFADGNKGTEEQERIKEVFNNLGVSEQAVIYQKALLKQTSIEQEVQELKSPELRQLAYEMAVFICEADNSLNLQEQEFLAKLRAALNIPELAAKQVHEQAESISQSPVDINNINAENIFCEETKIPQEEKAACGAGAAGIGAEGVCAGAEGEAAGAGGEAGTAGEAGAAADVGAEVDSSILKNAMLCSGLELLPDSISTIAIIPLQMRMVYNVGVKYGYKLDTGHIKEFIATLGIGMTSQVVEGFARKIFGGVIRIAGGRFASGVAKEATSVMMTFATTYALGRIAKMYYSSGRKLAASELKGQFQKEVTSAKDLYGKYSVEIAEKAKKISPSAIMNMIRGKSAV